MRPKRTGIVLRPDKSRVFFRPFEPPTPERALKIIARAMSLSDSEARQRAERVLREFGDRHTRLHGFFLRRFEQIRHYLISDQHLSEHRKLLLGAYFTQEYALEAAALFNPSMVPHPDQSRLKPGELRFVVSLRATGEGHISSITFRTGVLDENAEIRLGKPTPFVTAADVEPDPDYSKPLFQQKLYELGIETPFAALVLRDLGEHFTYSELEEAIERALQRDRHLRPEDRTVANGILSLARANYAIFFEPNQPITERVIFPNTDAERRGIEDARFVAFRDELGELTYYATYTAFDGEVILPQILETKDFLRFRISTLNGPEVQNKGMAIFPRKVRGLYAVLSRQDNENIYIMFSESLHFWYTKQILLRPTYPWEFVQLGNCGSPIETEAGWLVLTHGVGPMRKYAIGAVLLDLEDPTIVIGRLPEPILTPTESEREGYVPNVVYSCGGMVHAGRLILPYAMSDQSSSFAVYELDELLEALLRHGATARRTEFLS